MWSRRSPALFCQLAFLSRSSAQLCFCVLSSLLTCKKQSWFVWFAMLLPSCLDEAFNLKLEDLSRIASSLQNSVVRASQSLASLSRSARFQSSQDRKQSHCWHQKSYSFPHFPLPLREILRSKRFAVESLLLSVSKRSVKFAKRTLKRKKMLEKSCGTYPVENKDVKAVLDELALRADQVELNVSSTFVLPLPKRWSNFADLNPLDLIFVECLLVFFDVSDRANGGLLLGSDLFLAIRITLGANCQFCLRTTALIPFSRSRDWTGWTFGLFGRGLLRRGIPLWFLHEF